MMLKFLNLGFVHQNSETSSQKEVSGAAMILTLGVGMGLDARFGGMENTKCPKSSGVQRTVLDLKLTSPIIQQNSL
jgi:hypothetical protein